MSDLEYRLSELERRFENLARLGTVEQLDEAAAKVRVRSGDLLTGWINWLTHRAGPDKDWWAPEPGEQVLLVCPSGEPMLGVAIPALYQTAYPAPANLKTVHRTTYADGTIIEYDRAAHRLLASVRGDVEIIADNDLTATVGRNATVTAGTLIALTAPQVTMFGNFSIANQAGIGAATEEKNAETTHTGSYTLTGPQVITGNSTINGNLQVNGNITATGTIIDGGGNTNHHSH